MCKGCKFDSDCEPNGNESICGDEHLCPFFEPVEFIARDRLTTLSNQQFPASMKTADINKNIASILPDSIRYAH